MNTESLIFLNSLDKLKVSNEELLQFTDLIEKEPSKDEKRKALEHFLTFYEIEPDHIINLVKSNLIKQSIDLQYSLKKYITNREFKEAEIESNNESVWKKIFYSLGGL